MPEKTDSNVWLWKEPDFRWKKEVLNQISSKRDVPDAELVVLHCTSVTGFDDSIPLANFILNVSENFDVFQKERTMFLNPKDLSHAIEICLERVKNKSKESKVEITDESIISCHKAYVKHLECHSEDFSDKAVLDLKHFIEENNCADLWLIYHQLLKLKAENDEFVNYLSRKKFLILGTPQLEIFQTVLSLLTKNIVRNVTIETPLNISFEGSPNSNSSSIEVVTKPLNIEELRMEVDEIVGSLGSATEEYIEDTIASFLSLLVNSRNELSLFKVMSSPLINLSHDAFTALKHISQEKEMPMCQTAISYITRMKLGGKGYAPPDNCPMLPHVKILELFVDTLNQIQTIIEEDLRPSSAIKRVINILKKKLLKCEGEKLNTSSIEKACEKLKNTVTRVLVIYSNKVSKTDSPQICQENLDFLHYFVNYINSSCWTYDPQKILLEKNSKRTPINVPPLLGYFRSPEDESSCDVNSLLDEDSRASKTSMVVAIPPPVSYFHHSESSTFSICCVDSTTPSKTSFKDCLNATGNDCKELDSENSKPVNKKTLSKGRKRSILSEITNEVPSKKVNKLKNLREGSNEELAKIANKSTKPNNNLTKPKQPSAKAPAQKGPKVKAKVSKKFKQIEGQGMITSFFMTK